MDNKATLEELQAQLLEKRTLLSNLYLKTDLKSHEIPSVRRDIARISTQMRQKELTDGKPDKE